MALFIFLISLLDDLRKDFPAHYVQAKYQEYWECKRMFKLVQIYEEAKYDLHDLLRLHNIFKELGVGEHDIRNVFELVKEHQLEHLQGKVEYLKNEMFVLELEKMKATNHILVLNKRIDGFQGTLNIYDSPWVQKTGEMTYMNQEPRMLQGPINYGAANLYPQPNANWYSLDISYTHMNDYWP